MNDMEIIKTAFKYEIESVSIWRAVNGRLTPIIGTSNNPIFATINIEYTQNHYEPLLNNPTVVDTPTEVNTAILELTDPA